jgi:hypothetical protein
MQTNRKLFIFSIFLFLSIAGTVLLSTYTRYHADDYCIAASAAQSAPLTFFKTWYTGWTGRFAYIPLAGFFSLGGPQWMSWLPAASLFIWIAAMYWSILPLMQKFLSNHSRISSLITAQLILLLITYTSPNYYQSMFWKDGLINYTFPLILLTWTAGFLLRVWFKKSSQNFTWIPVFFLSLVSGGFSEAYSVMQVTLYVFLVILVAFSPKLRSEPISRVLIAAFVGAAIALSIEYFAPGNHIRQDTMPDHPGFIRLITFTLRSTLSIIAKFFIQHPGWALLNLIPAFLFGWYITQDKQTQKTWHWRSAWQKIWLRSLVLFPAFAFLLTTAVCAPVVYILNAYPDERIIYIPTFIIVIASAVSAASLGYGLRHEGLLPHLPHKNILWPGLMAGIVIAAFASIWNTASLLPYYQDYTSRWETRHNEITTLVQSGKTDLIIFGLESRYALSDIKVEPDYWVNSCMANYYGANSITGK